MTEINSYPSSYKRCPKCGEWYDTIYSSSEPNYKVHKCMPPKISQKEKCPHLDCLVYHPNGVCNCDMVRYCQECEKTQKEEPKEKDVWADFWTKAKHVFIGFSNGGEYNNYLSQIDDEGKRFIEDFIEQNFIPIKSEEGKVYQDYEKLKEMAREDVKKDLIKELEGMKKQIGYNVWAGNIDENHNAAVGYSQAIDDIVNKINQPKGEKNENNL